MDGTHQQDSVFGREEPGQGRPGGVSGMRCGTWVMRAPLVDRGTSLQLSPPARFKPAEIQTERLSIWIYSSKGWNTVFIIHFMGKKKSSTIEQFKKALICDKMLGFPGGWDGKESCLQWWETQVWSLGQEDPLEKEIPIPFLYLPGESHWQRSLVGHSPWGCKQTQLSYWHDRIFYPQLSVKWTPYFCVFIGRGGNSGEQRIFKLKLCKKDWPTNRPSGSKTTTKNHCKMTII